jgi:prepilin-type N-terminal cleavage/methylation domain-containing protein
MSTPRFGRQPGKARRGGFTLIEVAIALAIFVFGALAIVQIFPPALGVIRNNESRITATQLGENTLAQFKTKTTPPPEAIFDVDATITDPTNPYKWNDYSAAVVGTSNKNGSLPRTVTDFNTSALARFRYIYGEPHYIRAGQTILLNRPYDSAGGPASAFYDRIVEGVQINEAGYLDFTNAYMVDGTSLDAPYNTQSTPFNNGSTRPPASHRRTTDPATNVIYYVSYRWREATSPTVIRGVLEEPLSIPDDSHWTNDPSRVLPCVIASANKVIPGTVRVRMRHGLPASSSTVGGDLTVTSSVAGLFYISYLSRDWRQMTDYSAPVDNVVQLPLNGLEENSISGMLTNSNQSLTPILSTAPSVPPAPYYPVAAVDYKKGAVTYSFPATTGARIRTVYQTLDGWATQISVAPRTYVPYFDSAILPAGTSDNFPREPWREYVWSSADRSNIYFHASEAGKTVAISLSDGSATVSTTVTIDNIQDAPAGLGGAGNFAPSGKVARATLTQPNGDPATATTAILSVQGLSVQARTAWLNADKYNQVIVPGYRNLLQ